MSQIEIIVVTLVGHPRFIRIFSRNLYQNANLLEQKKAFA